jgi:hypothetical protein
MVRTTKLYRWYYVESQTWWYEMLRMGYGS